MGLCCRQLVSRQVEELYQFVANRPQKTNNTYWRLEERLLVRNMLPPARMTPHPLQHMLLTLQPNYVGRPYSVCYRNCMSVLLFTYMQVEQHLQPSHTVSSLLSPTAVSAG